MLNEEFHRAGVPRVSRGMGESLVGPSIIMHGTHEQRAHFLRRIISGEDVYCQGFSEPNHGSDLAAVETRGVIDGDEIVITGQKVWTSGAHRANRMFLLCRTDPGAEKHTGISYVLIDFTAPAYLPADQADVWRRGVLPRTSWTASGRRCSTSSAGSTTAGGWR